MKSRRPSVALGATPAPAPAPAPPSSGSGSGGSGGVSGASAAALSRSARVSASLSAYVDSLNKKAEAINRRNATAKAAASGPLLTPLPPKGTSTNSASASAAATAAGAGSLAATSTPAAPALPSSSTASRVAEEKSASSPRSPVSTKAHTGAAASGRSASKRSSRGSPPAAARSLSSSSTLAGNSAAAATAAAARQSALSVQAGSSERSTEDHRQTGPRRESPSTRQQQLQQQQQQQAEATLAPYSLNRNLAHPTAGTDSDTATPADAAPTSAAEQRSSMRPWFLNIQEQSTAASGRTYRRARVLHEQISATRNWGRQVRDMIGSNEATFARRGRAEMEELQSLQAELAQKQEIAALQLESVAAICDPATRARVKKARQLALVQSDHPRLRALEEEKSAQLDSLWHRSHVRCLRVQEAFCASWEVVNFFGNKLHEQAQSLIQHSHARSLRNLAQLRRQIPGHITQVHAMQIGMQEFRSNTPGAGGMAKGAAVPAVFANTPGIGVTTTAAAAAGALSAASLDDAPSDFRFIASTADGENGISLRLPTSISSGKHAASAIDHRTGLFNQSFAAQQTGAAAASGRSANDRNHTCNREFLSLLHSNMTIVHTAPPTLNPCWVTLSSEFGPKLLQRSADQLSSSPAYRLIYDELQLDLERLVHRTHVLDMAEQALHNYQQVQQLNVERSVWEREHDSAAAGLSAAASPAVGPFGRRGPKPLTVNASDAEALPQSQQVQARLQHLLVELECCGFGPDLDAFRASSAGPLALTDLSLSMLKALTKMLLVRFAERSRFYSRFYFEVHPHSQKTSWFAGFVLPPFVIEPGSGGAKSAAVAAASQPISVLDVDLYSTDQTTLALHSDGATFVCGHSRRVLQPLHDATVVGFVIDLLHGTIHYTVDGASPRIIFGPGASMYTVDEQRQQQEWICSQRLRPCFGVLGPQIKLSHASNRITHRDDERERHRRDGELDSGDDGANPALVDKSKRSRHALTAHSTLAADDGAAEAAGTIFARDPQPSANGAAAAGNDATANESILHETAAPSRPSVSDSGSAKDSSTASLSAVALHRHHNDGLIGWVIPKLSVNLGAYDFLYLPQGSNMGWQPRASDRVQQAWSPTGAARTTTLARSEHGRSAGYNAGLGACLAMNTAEAPLTDVSLDGHDNSLVHAFAAHKKQQAAQQALAAKKQAAADQAMTAGATVAQIKSMATGGAATSVVAVAAVTDGSSSTMPANVSLSSAPTPSATVGASGSTVESAVSEYKQRQSAAALQAIDQARQLMLLRPSAADLRKAAEEQKASFVKSLAASNRLVSWSHFPPHSIRVQQAVLKVQRIARRYIGFKQRRALWDNLSKYASRIQRAYRAFRQRRNKRLLVAVLPIQRMWRGFKARRVVRLLRKYRLSFAAANLAAVRIQSFIRMLLARKKVLMLAMIVQQKIEQIKGLVIFVQRMFRRRLQKRQQMASKSMLASVLLFQARIRGIRLRRMLAAIDPHAARQLKSIASSVGVKQRRYSAVCLIQRVWRGFVARKFVRAKRHLLERDAQRLRDAWRAFQLRRSIDRLYAGHDAAHLKTFFHALGYCPQQQQQQNQQHHAIG